jgi:hypothetical protein
MDTDGKDSVLKEGNLKFVERIYDKLVEKCPELAGKTSGGRASRVS